MPIIDCPPNAPARAYDLIELAVPGDTTVKITWPDLAQLCGFGAIIDRPNALTRDACVRYFDAWAQERAELFDAMARGFTTTMLWADAAPIDMDDNGQTGGLQDRTPTPELRARAMMFCMRFYASAGASDIDAHMDAFGDPDGGHPGEYVGHTFYLAAAGHGVAFTDRAWRDDDPMTAVCKRLNVAARAFREVEHLYAFELADGTVSL
jgi:hypothetical protein